MATASLKVVEQNTAPQFQITCVRDDGSIIDLTNTTVTLDLYKGTTKTNTGHEACTIITATTGVMGWQPGVGDFSGPGTFKGNVTVTYSDSTFETLYGQAIFAARKKIS